MEDNFSCRTIKYVQDVKGCAGAEWEGGRDSSEEVGRNSSHHGYTERSLQVNPANPQTVALPVLYIRRDPISTNRVIVQVEVYLRVEIFQLGQCSKFPQSWYWIRFRTKNMSGKLNSTTIPSMTVILILNDL